jgi:hypothetical protein
MHVSLAIAAVLLLAITEAGLWLRPPHMRGCSQPAILGETRHRRVTSVLARRVRRAAINPCPVDGPNAFRADSNHSTITAITTMVLY